MIETDEAAGTQNTASFEITLPPGMRWGFIKPRDCPGHAPVSGLERGYFYGKADRGGEGHLDTS
jgi:hypothetical protein